jgi:hypothetical protein
LNHIFSSCSAKAEHPRVSVGSRKKKLVDARLRGHDERKGAQPYSWNTIKKKFAVMVGEGRPSTRFSFDLT